MFLMWIVFEAWEICILLLHTEGETITTMQVHHGISVIRDYNYHPLPPPPNSNHLGEEN
jgi:hypothetical protein